ncbi:MAG: ABC transporter permease [Myxococcota bacterium]
MSVQTGVELPPGPASERWGDRVAYRWRVWRHAPNPLWVREMRQSARLLRTPAILAVVTILVTLLMATVGGGMASGTASPAEVGRTLYHLYFSVAYFIVAWVGPAIGANAIASEREGRTWEAVLLTGMHPALVARGKFASAFTSMASYLAMLAPVGALPFLFGGVTPWEVLVAFVFLLLIAALAVAFGLAISAQMESLRGALLVALLASVPLSGFLYLTMGVALSGVPAEIWPEVPRSLGPVWLPSAWTHAPFGLSFVLLLVLLPAAVIGLPGWLIYELTRARLLSVTDDRSFGLKRWFIVASLLTLLTAALPAAFVPKNERSLAVIAGMSGYSSFVVFNAFLFAGEAIGPSRRVRVFLARAKRWRRALGPGVVEVTRLQLALMAFAFFAIAGIGLAAIHLTPGTRRVTMQTEQIVVFSAYALGFSYFVIGLGAYVRSRSTGGALPRIVLLSVLTALSFLPWILAAILGLLNGSTSPGDDAALIAALSPGYGFVAAKALSRPDPGLALIASMVASTLYACFGAGLGYAAGARCRRIIESHETLLREADERLAAEDAAATAVRPLPEAAAS